MILIILCLFQGSIENFNDTSCSRETFTQLAIKVQNLISINNIFEASSIIEKIICTIRKPNPYFDCKTLKQGSEVYVILINSGFKIDHSLFYELLTLAIMHELLINDLNQLTSNILYYKNKLCLNDASVMIEGFFK